MRLFNKFFRATNARKQRPDGTGAGLYLARKVITAHGGSSRIELQTGQWRLRLASACHWQNLPNKIDHTDQHDHYSDRDACDNQHGL